MTIEEAKAFFESTDFSAETKAEIMRVLEGKEELGYSEVAKIKIIMQMELNRDLEAAGLDYSENSAIKRAEAAHAENLRKIEAELAADVAFVESELAALDDARKKAMAIEDQLAVQALKESI